MMGRLTEVVGMRGRIVVPAAVLLLMGAGGCAGAQPGGGGVAPVASAASDGDASGGDAAAGAGPPLVGTEWRLAQVVEPSGSWETPEDVDSVLRFDGDGGFSARACNHFGGTVEVEGDAFRLGEYARTDMGCLGPGGDVQAAFEAVMTPRQEVRWAIVDGELRLDAPDGHGLRYRVRDEVFPNPEQTPLLEARGERGAYRFAWQQDEDHVGLEWVYRSGPGRPWGTAGMGRPVNEPVTAPDVLSAAAGENRFVFGIVPLETAEVVSEPAGGGQAVELELFPIPAAEAWLAFGGFVEEASASGSVVVALDADGRELGRSAELP